MKKLVLVIFLGSWLTACGFPASAIATPTKERVESTIQPTATATPLLPTETVTPTLTVTASPTPDLGALGLPSEPAGSVAFDFVEQMCAAEWYTRGYALPCPGDASQADSGYVMRLDGKAEGIPDGFPMLLTFPPLVHYSTIFGKYPPFTVQKGDRFRTVTACQARSICDVEFVLNFFNGGGQRGLTRWQYLFIDEPVVVDYSLDSLAGETVQFGLAVKAIGGQADMHAVWIAPHIYRPVP